MHPYLSVPHSTTMNRKVDCLKTFIDIDSHPNDDSDQLSLIGDGNLEGFTVT